MPATILAQEVNQVTDSLNFTESEWELLESAPMMAGLLVGDLSAPEGWVNELNAVFDAAEWSEHASGSLLLRAVTERMVAREGDSIDLPADLPGSPAEARAHLIAGCRQAVKLVQQKLPAEAVAYRQWLLLLARKAAESTKEGGFLGIGGTLISAEERSALHELETALAIAG
ncbi:MAG: hypothetical protein M9936_08235 [Caldilinea sp.]|nr:hypothetical protein [Caldilineaceae bacterium]MCB9122703.1 hypothetical protein [Caldilineaceae bacterium]MCB9124804.1 hypothetical protein [Caldilineaceae bacterium]MCO5209668.1 hypothetical protein [Caldilinea sp.]MCW5843931.1 hypothetical protein [Caldilinea sp.]